MRVLSLALVLALALPAGARQEADAGRGAARERLRLLVALDLDAEAVRSYAERVREGGAWSRDGEALALFARALFGTGREEEALALLRAARAGDGALDDPVAVELEEARTLLALDRLDQALSLLAEPGSDGARPRRAARPEAWLLLARARVRRGAGGPGPDPVVETLCRRFLELAPRHPEAPSAWHVLARQALARHDGAEGRRCLERAGELERWGALLRARELQILRDPGAPLPRLGLALLWEEAGETAGARALLEELVAAHPDFADGHWHLARLLLDSGRLEAARASYARYRAAGGERTLEIPGTGGPGGDGG